VRIELVGLARGGIPGGVEVLALEAVHGVAKLLDLLPESILRFEALEVEIPPWKDYPGFTGGLGSA
jgi:hypothetical protein